MSKIYLAGDHAFFELKEKLLRELELRGHEVVDVGAHTLDTNDDYPTMVAACALRVAEDAGSFGIVGGGSGQGEAMVANRQPGVRAAVFYGGPMHLVRLAREHNDANVLSLGARFVTDEEAFEAAELFVGTPFSHDERHVRRIAQF